MSKILVVDDAPFMRKMLSDILVKNGFEVAGEASDGVEAVQMYKALLPDAVLLDINMPRKDGIETLLDIRAYDEGAICIICSDIGQHSMIHRAIECGAKEFIVKPFVAEKIVSALNKQLKRE